MPRRLAPLLAAVLAVAAGAQTTLDGVLVAPDGAPLADAFVGYESARLGPGLADTARTDRDGRFRLRVAAPGALVVRPESGRLWLPLPIEGDGPPVALRLTVPASLGETAPYLDGFAASGSDPALAAALEIYVAAERTFRTPVQSDALDRAVEAMDAAVTAAPLDRKNAVRDSLGALVAPLYAEAARPRTEAYAAALPADADTLARAAHAVWGVFRVAADSAAVDRVLRYAPPSSSVWPTLGLVSTGVNNVLVLMARQLASEADPFPAAFERFVRALAYTNPDPNVRAQAAGVLVGQLTWSGDEAAAEIAGQRLLLEFPESRQAVALQRERGDDRRVRPGQPLPTYALRDLDDPAVTVRPEDFRGRTLLIDVWGTWCAPCVEELPALHALYERYHDDGLDILSVATYDTAEAIEAFRRERGFPMPWRHALLPDDEMEALRAAFEFSGIPAYLLIGPDGVVLAEGAGARGEALDAALAAHFGAD